MHKFHLEALTAASGRVMCFLLGSSILCGKKKQIVFSYVEGKHFLNLESFITWIISLNMVFYICHAEGQELKKFRVKCSQRHKVINQAAGQNDPVQ